MLGPDKAAFKPHSPFTGCVTIDKLSPTLSSLLFCLIKLLWEPEWDHVCECWAWCQYTGVSHKGYSVVLVPSLLILLINCTVPCRRSKTRQGTGEASKRPSGLGEEGYGHKRLGSTARTGWAGQDSTWTAAQRNKMDLPRANSVLILMAWWDNPVGRWGGGGW